MPAASSGASLASTVGSDGSSAGWRTWRRRTATSWCNMTTSMARSLSLRQLSRIDWRVRQNARERIERVTAYSAS